MDTPHFLATPQNTHQFAAPPSFFATAHHKISELMNLQMFAGVPILAINPDHLPDTFDEFEASVMARLSGYENALSAEILRQYFDDKKLILYKDIKVGLNKRGIADPYSVPCPTVDFSLMNMYTSEIGRRSFKPLHACIIVAPGMGHTPELMGVSIRGGPLWIDPSIKAQAPVYRYFILRHEFMHAAGGNEFNADMGAGLFTRKHFPGSKIPLFNSDYRAISVVRDAVCRGEVTLTPHTRHMFQNVDEYGWSVVEANDEVMALPQDDISAMSESAIIDTRFRFSSKKSLELVQLGKILGRNEAVRDFVMGEQGGCPSKNLGELDFKGREKMILKFVGINGGDDMLQRMTSRFLHAVHNWNNSKQVYSPLSAPRDVARPWDYT